MLVRQAFDGETIAEVVEDDAVSVEAKLNRASRAFADRTAWLPPYKRIEFLRRLGQAVERDSEMFATLIAREAGKPITDARVEVARAINGILSASAGLEHPTGSEIPMGLTASSEDRWALTIREPIGVVVAISAFNHPLNLIVHQIIPAIAAGCPVIVKPSPFTPLCCLCLVDFAHAAGVPEAWCQAVVTEDNTLAEKLVIDERVAFLSFFGAARVGRYLRSQLAPSTRCALEHGGVAPVLIDESARLDGLIDPLVKGGYYHAGQVCVSTQRIFVHENKFDDFIALFTERVQDLCVGDPMDSCTEVGPLILPREVTRVESWVNDATSLGGILVTGGKRCNDRLFRPTVILEPPPNAALSQQEVFGPVTVVYRFSSLAKAIDAVGGSSYTLHASIFTQDISSAIRAASSVNAPSVMINDMTAFRSDWMPFSGWAQSGLNTGGIGYMKRDMTREKLIILKP